MDNFDYRSWDKSHSNSRKYSGFNDESSLYSSPGYSELDNSGFSAKKRSYKSDISDDYDFEISNEGGFSSPVYNSKPSTKEDNRFGNIRRSSIDERTKEILERSRKSKPSNTVDPDERFSTFEATFAELMEGINVPKEIENSKENSDLSAPATPINNTKKKYDSSIDNSLAESLDISAADLEVGAIASRRMKEKAADRARRNSIDITALQPQKDFLYAKNSNSPDVRGRRASTGDLEGFQMSTALSSIRKSKSNTQDLDKKGEINNFGSIEKSDDDIYKMLNISAVNESYEKFSKLSNLDNDNSDLQNLRASEFANSDEINKSENISSFVHVNNETEENYDDENFYDDDFENEPNSSFVTTNVNKLDQLTNNTSISLPPKPKESKIQNSVEIDRLNTVEQIMQRWYNTDSSFLKSSLEDIGFQPLKSNDLKLTQQSEQIIKENAVKEHPDENKKDDEDNQEDINQVTIDDIEKLSKNDNNVHYEDDFGSVSHHSLEDDTENHDSRSGQETGQEKIESPSFPPITPNLQEESESESILQYSEAVLSTVGTSTLVTSIPPSQPPALIPNISIPNWSINDLPTLTNSLPPTPKIYSEIANSEPLLNDKIENNEGHSDKNGKFMFSAIPKPDQKAIDSNNSETNWTRNTRYDSDLFNKSEDEVDSILLPKNFNSKSTVSPRKVEDKKNIKLAPSTAAKLREKKNSNFEESNKKSKVSNKHHSLSVKKSSVPLTSQDEKFLKLAEENTILSNKFNYLQREMKELRKSGVRNSSDELDVPSKFMRLERSRSLFSDKDNVKDDFYFLKEISFILEKYRYQKDTNYIKDQEIQDVIQKLLDESQLLQERERKVSAKEKALSIRENLLLPKENFSKGSLDVHWKELESQLHSVLNEKDKLENEIQILRHREGNLLQEIDSLKSSLFDLKQKVQGDENAQQRKENGLSNFIEMNKTNKNIEQILKMLQETNKLTFYHKIQLNNLDSKYLNYKKSKAKDLKEINPDTHFPNSENNCDEENIAINRFEFEQLLIDYQQQELLIQGFQKENERLSAQLKKFEVENQIKTSQYFDQQENLNKELNYLRNLFHSNNNDSLSHPFTGNFSEQAVIITNQKTAKQLQFELENDKKLQYLSDKNNELKAEYQKKEVELLNKLHALTLENEKLNKQCIYYENSEGIIKSFENDKHLYQLEKSELLQKISWYQENQAVLDNLLNEKNTLTFQLNILKKELLQRGLTSKAIQVILKHAKSSIDEDDSILNQTQGSISNVGKAKHQFSGQRNFTDIKKIRELELIVKELQETLSKRYPDSIAGLLYANRVSDIQQERKVKLLQEENSQLKDELNQTQSQHDIRIRSLRMEHDKLKSHYEDIIQELQKNSKKKLNDTLNTKNINNSSTIIGHIESLPQALEKISSLELELSRVRSYYNKKIEEINKKHENTIRTMKRGQADENPQIGDVSDKEKEIQNLHSMYKKRLSLLEQELMETAQELGKLKALKARLSQTKDDILPPPPPPPLPTFNHTPHQAESLSQFQIEKMIEDRINKFALVLNQQKEKEIFDLKTQHQGDIDQIIKSFETKIDQAKKFQNINDSQAMNQNSNFEAQMKLLSSQWYNEKENFLVKISDQEKAISSLKNELLNAKQSYSVELSSKELELKSPSLIQFQILEKQLIDVQQRLERREKEMVVIVEDIKTTAKLDRNRLELLHAQELREKDDQLVQFQFELEKLILELHSLQGHK